MRTTYSVARLTFVGAGLSLALLTAPSLIAQDLERSVAVGAAVPVGGLGANRSMGPLLRG
jgi:ABC-type Mn2+/Zn2+ transport system permease subunit